MPGQSLGQQFRRVRAVDPPAAPVHRHRHHDVRLHRFKPRTKLPPHQFRQRERQRFAAAVFHRQQPAAQQSIVLAERNRFVEPQFRATAQVTALPRRCSWHGRAATRTGCTAQQLEPADARAAERRRFGRHHLGATAGADGWKQQVEPCSTTPARKMGPRCGERSSLRPAHVFSGLFHC